MNIPPVSIAAVKDALIEQFADPVLRRRASMLWGTRGVGKSSIVRQVAAHFDVPLIDLRLTTIEPVDIRGAIFADERQAKTVWFPPEFLPEARLAARHPVPGRADGRRPAAADLGLLADPGPARRQLPAAGRLADRRRRQCSLPRRREPRHGHGAGGPHVPLQRAVGHRRLPGYALANDLAPEVMAYLKVRPDKLDDTASQLANDHLVGASPRGWEDVSSVLKSDLSEAGKRIFVQGRIGAANAAEFFGVLREIQAGTDVLALLDAEPGEATAALLPTSLDGLYGMLYALVAMATDAPRMARALAILDQLPDVQSDAPLPIREVQTLGMELLFERALERGLEGAVLASPAYRRYSEARAAA
jgi:hypothetical protein